MQHRDESRQTGDHQYHIHPTRIAVLRHGLIGFVQQGDHIRERFPNIRTTRDEQDDETRYDCYRGNAAAAVAIDPTPIVRQQESRRDTNEKIDCNGYADVGHSSVDSTAYEPGLLRPAVIAAQPVEPGSESNIFFNIQLVDDSYLNGTVRFMHYRIGQIDLALAFLNLGSRRCRRRSGGEPKAAAFVCTPVAPDCAELFVVMS